MTPLKLSVLAGMLTASLVACTAESPEQEQGTQDETMRQPPTDTQQGQGTQQPGNVPPSDQMGEPGQTGDTGSMDQEGTQEERSGPMQPGSDQGNY